MDIFLINYCCVNSVLSGHRECPVHRCHRAVVHSINQTFQMSIDSMVSDGVRRCLLQSPHSIRWASHTGKSVLRNDFTNWIDELYVNQNQYNVNGCTVPAVSMMVTLLVCLLTIYCWLCVYGQFIHYAKYYSNASSDIKVSPIDDHDHHHNNDMARTAHPLHQSPNNNNEDMQNRDQQASSEMLFINNQPPNNNIHTLKVPQVSTPRDAW